ncbi:hypothetical protein A4S02_03140 [Acetobacter ascendens]|uniref:Uncharacterized protein n=1 Tax=Acetobacter ascendens TaxID=481146 RepID=A0A1D8QUF3_9PROT|nr:hypothetical protein A4S02_03140 [Acetobacter ascendens]
MPRYSLYPTPTSTLPHRYHHDKARKWQLLRHMCFIPNMAYPALAIFPKKLASLFTHFLAIM